jgi:hypothetical protein
MPNHITSYVQIKGTKKKLDALKKKTLQEKDGIAEFDFNGIIPMPAEVKRTGAGSASKVVATQAEADKINESTPTNNQLEYGIDTWAITQAEYDRRMQEYGATNWYNWANLHWGTKWGAYDVSVIANKDTELVLQHDTAWSPPEPVWDKLTEMGFEVNAIWQDEDPSNEGEYGDPDKAFDIDRRIVVEYMGEE